MKKLFFIAALSSIALVSCVKNEMDPSATQQDEITFNAPVVAPSTKAIIDGAVYPKTESFGVYAWHSSSNDPYMENVQVSNVAGLEDDQTGESYGEEGGWKPAQATYWPKEGTLDFDAYSPYSVNSFVSATKADGIVVTDYVVADPADTDLMYALRSKNKSNVNDGANDGIPYDGVDIAFKHALTAVQLKAKTASEYTGTTIVITSIEIENAISKGTFRQNESTSDPAWTPTATEDKYAYTDGTVSVSGIDCGTKLLLPQSLSDDLAVTITYTINGIEQTGTFLFKDHKNGKDESDGDVTVDSWEMGNKYVYTLVFTLDEIFFEPIVTDWETIIVS